MKKLFGIILFASLITLSSFVFGQATLKLGYIDSNELLQLMPEKDSVEARLMDYQKSLESQIEAMLMEYQTKVQQYRNTAATMSDIIKQTKEKEITDLETRIQQFQQTAELDFQNKQQELYNPLFEKARKAINDVADENGFTYIFDVSTGSLLYFEKGTNILPLVRKKMGI